MPSKAKNSGTIQAFPDADELNKVKARLPKKFPPVDVTGLFKLPVAKAKEEIGRLTSSVIATQLHQLLDGLGIDSSAPDAWERGFRHLATINYGAGHFTYKRPRPANRNARRMTPERDRLLYDSVIDREKQGKTRDKALLLIAQDDEICRQLRLSPSHRSEKSDEVLNFDALRKRMARIDKMAPPGSLLAAVTYDFPIYGSEKDKASWFKSWEPPPLPAPGKTNTPSKS